MHQKTQAEPKAIEIFPYFSVNLSKKKDANKADAILIASYFEETFIKNKHFFVLDKLMTQLSVKDF